MQQRYRSGGKMIKQAKRLYNPDRYTHDPVEGLPLHVLIRQIMLRIRRYWVALRFQANRYTLGSFQQRPALKLGILVFAVYVFFFTNWIDPGITPDVEEAGMQPEILELAGSTKSGAKSKPAKLKQKSEAAPVSSEELGGDQSSDYIARYSKIARTEMEKYGIPASISLAQGLIESRAGTSKLARNNNNHFGMKCFSKNCKKGHCSNFSDDHHKDFFRSFKNPWESWRAHSQMISSGRYRSLKKHGNDYKKWAYGLKSVGYATDRNYAEKLIGVIERYELWRYDR